MPRLTNRECAAAKNKINGHLILADGDGLYLKVRTTGTKVWYVDYLAKGVRRKANIGEFSESGGSSSTIEGLLQEGKLSLAQARLIAQEWKRLRYVGRDPIDEWKQSIEKKAALQKLEDSTPTVNEIIKLFMKQHIEGKKSARGVEYRLNRVAEYVGNRKINSLTRKEMIGVFDNIVLGRRAGKTAKQMAGEVLVTAKRLWRYAETREWISVSCIERLRRIDFDARAKKRNVVLRIDEVVQIWCVLSNPQICKADKVTVLAMKLIILTGQRESEVCEALWSEFDFGECLWRIPANRTKAGRAHLVHLAPQVLNCI